MKSIASVLSRLKHVRGHFGDSRAAGLADEAVDADIQKRLDAGRPPATVNRETQLLGQAYTLR